MFSESVAVAGEAATTGKMVLLHGGNFIMGSNHGYPEERPERSVSVEPFLIDRYPVTNEEFEEFVLETGYVTVAERELDPKLFPGVPENVLVPGSLVFRPRSDVSAWKGVLDWWDFIPGACWRRPGDAGSSLEGMENHPVVHVAFEDAMAYAKWAGKELPTETQWEYAARGGLSRKTYAWGDALIPNGAMMANIWLGDFPIKGPSSSVVGKTTDVGSYPPNGYGLYDMIGNVWEWTADWYASGKPSCCSPSSDDQRRLLSVDPREPHNQIGRKVVKGGSFLCAPNYCRRYRPAARQAQTIDSSTCHLGFRCVKRVGA